MTTKIVFLFLLGLNLADLTASAQSGNSQAAASSPTTSADAASTNAPASSISSTNSVKAASLEAVPQAPVTSPATVPDPQGVSAGAGPKAIAPTDSNRGPLVLEQDLPTAIQFLARMASLNIQFDPSLVFTNNVEGEAKAAPPMVSLRWENVTAEDALQEVLDNYGLMLVVNPKTQIGRVTRKQTTVPMVTSLVQLRYCSPTNVMPVIQATFGDPRDKITADMRTSQLVIVASERDMYAITNLINHLDTPTRQVLIEARVLETAKNPSTVKGIDWSGTLQNQNFSFGNGNTAGTVTTTTPGPTTTTSLPSGRTMNNTAPSGIASQLLTSIGGGGGASAASGIPSLPGGISANTMSGFSPATAFLNADGVHAVLSFLNSENDTEVVAEPRAVTADNELATLSVTRAYPIFQVTPGSANVAAAAQVQYTNLGTILKVTPRITANNNIALKVVPEVSNIDSKDQQIINGAVNQANVYAIRRMEANVVIPSGNTLVMGGLISDSSTKSFNKVPVLGDLPGLGLLFRHDAKSRNKVNLLIFVTPTIVQDQDFLPSPTTFLKTPIPDRPDKDESAWDSGKPYDWSRRPGP